MILKLTGIILSFEAERKGLSEDDVIREKLKK